MARAVDFLNEHFDLSDEQRGLVIWMLQNPGSVLGGDESGGPHLEMQGSVSAVDSQTGSEFAQHAQLGTQGSHVTRPRVNGLTNRVQVSWPSNSASGAPLPAKAPHPHGQQDELADGHELPS
eukprot:3081413-Pyramimonas_sp.AAC.1